MKNLMDDNSESSSIMSEEFPLYKTIVPEGNISNSAVNEFPDTNSCNDKQQLQNSLKNKNNQDSKTEEENKVSKRRRYIPKVFTPESNNKNVWCLCQQEDKGFYVLCDLKKPGCLEFYHPTCVGLGHLKSLNDCENYSNCSDGKSYICPLCAGKVSREQWYNSEDILSISKIKHKITDVVGEEIDSPKCADNSNLNSNKENNVLDKNEKEGNTYVSLSNSTDVRENSKGKKCENMRQNYDFLINHYKNSYENSSQTGDIGNVSSFDDDSKSDLSDGRYSSNIRENRLGNKCKQNDDFRIKHYTDSDSSENSSKDMSTAEDNDFDSDSSDELATGDVLGNDCMENIECLPCDLESESCDECSDGASSKCEPLHSDDVKKETSDNMPVPHETLQRMMDCPTLPTENTFFLASLPTSACFRLSTEEWDRIRPTTEKPNTLRCPWTDIMARYMKESNDYCTFHFCRHYIAKENSRKRNIPVVFSAYGHCIFEDCSCKFKLEMRRRDKATKRITVFYEGSVKHSAGERQSRFIKSDIRKEMASKFHKGPDKPSKMYQEIKDTLSVNAKASGNRSGCGNQPCTIRKIASEGHQQTQLEKDVMNSLKKVMDELIKREGERVMPPKIITGFVHAISFYPLWVYMWNEDQVRLWHHLCAKDIAYLDATGTIVRDFMGKRVLYYAIVVRHPKESNPPMPVAEMITNDHSAQSIRTFIERFRRDEGVIFKGKPQIPRQMNTDYSKAIILAALREFNGESLEQFLIRVFRILTKKASNEDLRFMVLHVGCSHFMSIMHRRLKAIMRSRKKSSCDGDMECQQNDIWYRFNMYCVSLLVNARTLDEFDSILEDVATCLLNERQNNDVLKSFDILWQMIHRMEQRGETFKTEEVIVKYERDEEDDDGNQRGEVHCNPLNNHYNKLTAAFKKRASDKNEKEISDECQPNRSYCPDFFAIIESYLSEMPLWSGVLLGSLDRYIDESLSEYDNLDDYPYLSFKSANARTEGYIEGMMRNLKQEDFPGRRRLRADAFVLENYPRIRRRLNDFSDRIVSKKTKKQKDRASKAKKAQNSSEKVKIIHVDKHPDASQSIKSKPTKKESNNTKEVESNSGVCKAGQTRNQSQLNGSKDFKPCCKESVERIPTKVDTCFNDDKDNAKVTSVIDVDEYSNAQETWGKKDPATPKRNPKIGQFQQSPSVPLSKTPDIKKKKKSGHSSTFFEFLHKGDKKNRTKERRKLTDLAKEAGQIWRDVPMEDKKKFQSKTKEGDRLKRKRESPFYTSKEDKSKEQNVSMRNTNNANNSTAKVSNVIRGLKNKGNDCWLNSLIQCINSLNIVIPENTSDLVASALKSTLNKLNSGSKSPFYPQELLNVFRRHFGYEKGRQHDIHESYTSLLSQNARKEITENFIGVYQYTKSCVECYKKEVVHPETFNSLYIALDYEVTDLVESIEGSLTDCVDQYCENCASKTPHIRFALFNSMPQIMTIVFKRFVNDGNMWQKCNTNVQIPRHFDISSSNVSHGYRLSSCALHYGLQLECGHYSAVVFKGDEIYEISDTNTKNISCSWKNTVASHVYVAFYSLVEKKTEKKFEMDDSNSPCPQQEKKNENKFEIDGSDSPCAQQDNIDCVEVSDGESVKSETRELDENVPLLPDNIEIMKTQFYHLCDASLQNKRVCTQDKQGYDLYGRDFKTLEPLVAKKSNESYVLENPGWLNDKIIDVYLSLLEKECINIGIKCFAFNTQFITKLRSVSIPGKEDDFKKMISRHYRHVSFDLLDAMIIPINVSNGRHWCIIVIDPRKQLIFFYDPLQRGIQRVSLLEMIKHYFRELFQYRSYSVEINGKKFVSEFEVFWEDRFPIQEDFICCGVYILSYARYKLDLFNGMPCSEIINLSRPIIAFELLQGKFITSSIPKKYHRNCIVPTTYAQVIGQMVTIRCSFTGEKPLKFEWIFRNMSVSSEQTHNFLLKEDKMGTYFCRVTFRDGQIINSDSCMVTCI